MKHISHFKLGLFFLAGLAVIASGLFWLGSTGYFQETRTCVTYFGTSVQGLSMQSDVKYLGMRVGKVESLQLAPRDQSLVRVVFRLDADFALKDHLAVRRAIKGITGQACLALVEAPKDLEEMTPQIDFPVQHPFIPSIPGRVEQVSRSLAELYGKLEGLDVGGLIREWKVLAQNADATLNELGTEEAFRNLRTASRDIRSVASRLEEITGPLAEPRFVQKLQGTISDLAETSRSAREIADAVQEQTERLKPDAAADIAAKLQSGLDRMQSSLQRADDRFGESMVHLEQSLVRFNQALSEIQALARSLRIDPGRILNQTESNEPFQK